MRWKLSGLDGNQVDEMESRVKEVEANEMEAKGAGNRSQWRKRRNQWLRVWMPKVEEFETKSGGNGRQG
jgi:hypothetical protein